MQWGMDLLGPITPATDNLKYLTVPVDYFTKWIEVKALAKITLANALNVFNKKILARFEVS